TILPNIARETGLPLHTRICAGGHDHICGALAVGVTEPGTMLNSLGTAEAMCLPISQPLTDPQIGRQNFTIGAHVAPDQYYFLGGLFTSGASIEWFRSLFGEDADYNTLISEASESPPGSLGVGFLPQLRFTNPPHAEAIARGTFIGLTPDVNRGTLFRAILEGLSLEMRHIIDASKSHPDVPETRNIVAIGGGIRNQLLMQIKATVLNQPIALAEMDEATALGAAVLAGLGTGVYADITDALHTLDIPLQTIHPIPEQVAHYNRIYNRVHKQIYPAVQDLHHQIDQIQMTTVR
ncbi:MAG: FGGY-family carbohydrate kinase, partial [Gemmatimonadota bacterium]|nr:FGGY-family carbohydrate kinase [Gemmatimonadota bacterium]